MSNHGIIEELTDNLKSYISDSYEIHKLETIGRSSIIGSKLISGLIIMLIVSLFLFFVSLWVGLMLSAYHGDSYSGFTWVAGFYFVLGIIFILGRRKLLQRPIRDKIIRKTLNGNQK